MDQVLPQITKLCISIDLNRPYQILNLAEKLHVFDHLEVLVMHLHARPPQNHVLNPHCKTLMHALKMNSPKSLGLIQVWLHSGDLDETKASFTQLGLRFEVQVAAQVWSLLRFDFPNLAVTWPSSA